MSRFYASIEGQAGIGTRRGSAKSGIRGHVRGWNVGVEVFGRENENGEDEFEVYLTGGSKRGTPDKIIGRFTKADLDKT